VRAGHVRKADGSQGIIELYKTPDAQVISGLLDEILAQGQDTAGGGGRAAKPADEREGLGPHPGDWTAAPKAEISAISRIGNHPC
jgi:hypothetical protein